jgi:hypothetical protein
MYTILVPSVPEEDALTGKVRKQSDAKRTTPAQAARTAVAEFARRFMFAM